MDTLFTSTCDTISTYLLNDTLAVSVIQNGNMDSSWLDVVYQIAMIIVGIVNLCFAFYIFFYQDRKEKLHIRLQDRKYMLENFILKFKLECFYDSFKQLLEESSSLIDDANKNNLDNTKKDVESKYQEIFSNLRIYFIESLSAIDNNLYMSILSDADALQGKLSEALFDDGVILNKKAKYEELIQNPIFLYQGKMLKTLCDFGKDSGK